jgi:hypothetical protein
MPVIPAFRRMKQDDNEFKPNLGNMAKPYLKKIYK